MSSESNNAATVPYIVHPADVHPAIYAINQRRSRVPVVHDFWQHPTHQDSTAIPQPIEPVDILDSNEHSTGPNGPLILYDFEHFNDFPIFEGVKPLPLDTMEEKYEQKVNIPAPPPPPPRQVDAATSSVPTTNAVKFVPMPPARVIYSPPREYSWEEGAQAIEDFDWNLPEEEQRESPEADMATDAVMDREERAQLAPGEVMVEPDSPHTVPQILQVPERPTLHNENVRPSLHNDAVRVRSGLPTMRHEAAEKSPPWILDAWPPATTEDVAQSSMQMPNSTLEQLNPALQALKDRLGPNASYEDMHAALRRQTELQLITMENRHPKVVQDRKDAIHRKRESARSYISVMDQVTDTTVALLDIVDATPQKQQEMSKERDAQIMHEHLENGIPAADVPSPRSKAATVKNVLTEIEWDQRSRDQLTLPIGTATNTPRNVLITHKPADLESRVKLWNKAEQVYKEAIERRVLEYGEQNRGDIEAWYVLRKTGDEPMPLDGYMASKLASKSLRGQTEYNGHSHLPPLGELLPGFGDQDAEQDVNNNEMDTVTVKRRNDNHNPALLSSNGETEEANLEVAHEEQDTIEITEDNIDRERIKEEVVKDIEKVAGTTEHDTDASDPAQSVGSDAPKQDNLIPSDENDDDAQATQEDINDNEIVTQTSKQYKDNSVPAHFLESDGVEQGDVDFTHKDEDEAQQLPTKHLLSFISANPYATIPHQNFYNPTTTEEALSILKGSVIPSSPTRLSETSFPSGTYDHETSSPRNPSSAARSHDAHVAAHAIAKGFVAASPPSQYIYAGRPVSPSEVQEAHEVQEGQLASSPPVNRNRGDEIERDIEEVRNEELSSSPGIIVARRPARSATIAPKPLGDTGTSDNGEQESESYMSDTSSDLSDLDEEAFASPPPLTPLIPRKRSRPDTFQTPALPASKKTKVEVKIGKKATPAIVATPTPAPAATTNEKAEGKSKAVKKTPAAAGLDQRNVLSSMGRNKYGFKTRSGARTGRRTAAVEGERSRREG